VVSKNKNKSELDVGVADRARIDADTVGELKEVISKLAASKDRVGALEQNDLSGMVTFLESFDSPAAEKKFILHHITQAVEHERPELLLRWAMVCMLRITKIPLQNLHEDVLKVLPRKPH
jgi:hypothetical protein